MVWPIVAALALTAGISYGGKRVIQNYLRWKSNQAFKLPSDLFNHSQLIYFGEKLPKDFLGTGFRYSMNEVEAKKILDLKGKCTTEDIKLAHRRMMRINHPDHGGSQFLGRKINEAKGILMDK